MSRELRLQRLEPVDMREDNLYNCAGCLGLERVQPAEKHLIRLLVGRAVGRDEKQIERPLDQILLLAARV